MVRVLITLSPLMYRQAVALSVQGARDGLVDVRVASPERLEAELDSFGPHLLVCNDARGDRHGDGTPPIPESVLRRAPCCLEVIYTDGMDAHLSADGSVTEMLNASTDDLLAAVDKAAEMAERDKGPIT